MTMPMHTRAVEILPSQLLTLFAPEPPTDSDVDICAAFMQLLTALAAIGPSPDKVAFLAVDPFEEGAALAPGTAPLWIRAPNQAYF